MPAYRHPLHVPQGAVGYDNQVVRAAGEMLASRGPELVPVLTAVARGEKITEEDRGYFLALADAAQHVLVMNQLPPPDWNPYQARFDDVE